MKYFIIALLCFVGKVFGQVVPIVYTPMSNPGYQYKYMKIDSGLSVPFWDTTIGRGTIRPGSIVCGIPDSLFYGWNGRYWALMGADVAALVAKINTKVDSVTVNGDALNYWINGVSYGQIFSFKEKGDSVDLTGYATLWRLYNVVDSAVGTVPTLYTADGVLPGNRTVDVNANNFNIINANAIGLFADDFNYMQVNRSSGVMLNAQYVSLVSTSDINLNPTSALLVSGAAGNSGDVLTSQGAGTPPLWLPVSAPTEPTLYNSDGFIPDGDRNIYTDAINTNIYFRNLNTLAIKDTVHNTYPFNMHYNGSNTFFYIKNPIAGGYALAVSNDTTLDQIGIQSNTTSGNSVFNFSYERGSDPNYEFFNPANNNPLFNLDNSQLLYSNGITESTTLLAESDTVNAALTLSGSTSYSVPIYTIYSDRSTGTDLVINTNSGNPILHSAEQGTALQVNGYVSSSPIMTLKSEGSRAVDYFEIFNSASDTISHVTPNGMDKYGVSFAYANVDTLTKITKGYADNRFLSKANNLSDLTSTETAKVNMNLKYKTSAGISTINFSANETISLVTVIEPTTITVSIGTTLGGHDILNNWVVAGRATVPLNYNNATGGTLYFSGFTSNTTVTISKF